MTKLTLPPLPLVDGWLFIDNSRMENIQTCPRSAEYSLLHAKRAAGERSALNFGGGIHAALEVGYREANGLPISSSEDKMMAALTEHFSTHPQGDDEYRSVELATNLIRHYCVKYNIDDFEICRLSNGELAIEQSFAFPLLDDRGEVKVFYWTDDRGMHPVRVMYQGRIDMLVRSANQVFTLDHKTAFQFGQTFWQEQQMSGQHVGYCTMADKLLGCETSGYIINAIRTRKPSTKTPTNQEDFERQKYYITPERKQEWRRNLIGQIESFLFNYSNNYMPMNPKWCVSKYGCCQFLDVCQLPEPQRLSLLSSGMYVTDDWSPLKKISPSRAE